MGLVFYSPFDVVLTEHDVVQPDIIFVSNERKGVITENNIKGGPDLAIEILSLGTRERDILVKKDLYAKHGIREYRIVDQINKTIEVMIIGNVTYKTYGFFQLEDQPESPLLPGFNPYLYEIFFQTNFR